MNVEATTTQDELFQQQIEVLKKHLAADPRSLRNVFVADGTQAMAWEFQQPELGERFIGVLWNLLLREDDMSTVLQRFLWDLPLKYKRKFIRALDQHLSGRYPMFEGLSKGWPAENFIPPYVRPPEDRSQDFDLVNTGYLGYRALGYSLREVDLFVWLEVMRDKQCEDRPCELGVLMEKVREREAKAAGGCPVKIHIPEMLDLIGNGKIRQALELIESSNPLPNVTGRVCPQEHQCQGVCKHTKRPIEIGQLEWYLPEHEKLADPDRLQRFKGAISPWSKADKPPIAVVGSGPSGLINAYLLSVEGYPVTVFEAFHELGGVLRYGIPEFRLPNSLIDDVVQKIDLLGGKFVKNFVVGKSATLDDLKNAGFWKIFVGSGAGLPTFMNVPGEHLNGVMSANEFLTRVNLMRGRSPEYETPLPEVKDKHILVIGGGNTAMDAARTAKRLGGKVQIVYRRTEAEMPCRVEELHHALEEGIILSELRGPKEFVGDSHTHFVTHAIVDVNELGEPDASGRRRPQPTGEVIEMPADLVIMALGNKSNPIIPEAEPDLKLSKWGTIEVEEGQETSVKDVYTGGDAARGGSTAILAAGDGQAAARQIVGDIPFDAKEIRERVKKAEAYTAMGQASQVILKHTEVAEEIVEMTINAPVVAKAARAGQFVRVLASDDGELIPLTLADWDADAGTIDLVIQGLGTSSKLMNRMSEGESFSGIAGPLGRPSAVHRYAEDETVVFAAGGVGLPAIYPIAKAHLEIGNHVTMVIGFRSADHLFWTGDDERMGLLKAKYGDKIDIIYCTNDGSFGTAGFVTGPLEEMLKDNNMSKGRKLAEVISVGPPMMMRAVSDLTQPFGVPTVVSLNSIMVDATGMCGACMVPVVRDGKNVRMHACIDGPEFDAHTVEWDKFMPRFNQFKAQEVRSLEAHGL
ncbi:sulfide dehydrogenase (flavoprotein) subunit SudA /sulfide dehydrogenase (flavoprotein) subunit SudB [Aliiruegeria haliotis]|uniref:Sulfide dehydrogenase (Flavoprotein) subunit SudA /sulfide dehydrogenase (Flavoprotein) subunit SudB n=1 Tax=Aliiruegeria haliotis TaxID=1280846 RepID=A0A2T0RKS9_9RHOB|nr:sulfide/dihydroorotate dehydrogenase-like FAD/NAD-binding protein [Aliiruegeria haliotis]PRY21794.1 sulfide dehydrogenase (flavoprotein) subunit SudA /sulfide dehydrogenase (flavoprotein) subunit SudB [Aliiruegeria haliotis]